MGNIENYVLNCIKKEHCIHMTLVDPDKVTADQASSLALEAQLAGTSAIMIGGSTATSTFDIDNIVKKIKEKVDIPTILFPNNISGISQFADAIWFMSLLNSINPYFITGAQALGSTLVKRYNIEPLSMGYIIIGEGGTAAFVGHATPIPYNKPELAVIYSLAAQYLGMHFIYLEAGSGAVKPVPEKMITDVKKNVDVPLIVGGGIRSVEDATKTSRAGANIIVTGTILEQGKSLKPIIDAIKQ